MTSLKTLFDEAMKKENSKRARAANMNRRSSNKTGFKWLGKVNNPRYKNGYVWTYHRRIDYVSVNIYASDLFRLFDKVIASGYDWVVLNEERAQHTIESDGLDWKDFLDYMKNHGGYVNYEK